MKGVALKLLSSSMLPSGTNLAIQNLTLRAEKKQVSPEDKSDPSPPQKKIRLSRSTESTTKESCYFCEGTSEPLRAVSTYKVDHCVRKSALALQDGKLLAKLSAGDMMAQDAKYHPLCLASFYKRAKSLDDCKEDDSDKINHRYV